FALTDVILKRSEAYRFILSKRSDMKWPPSGVQKWTDVIDETARQWSECVEDPERVLPALLRDEWRVFRDRGDTALERLAEGHDWRMCEALLTLHTLADEACSGLGVAFDRADGRGGLYRARGRELLARTGSLSRIAAHVMRVLPKIRTPANGT